MRNKKGVTMIEAMAAITLLGLALTGFMKLQKAKMEDEMQTTFKYNLQKTMKGLETKIIKDGLTAKKYWRDTTITADNFQEHFKHNLIDKNSKCADELGHPNLGKDYRNCYMKLNVHQFQSNFIGKVKFDEDDHFKYYMFTFKPKTIKGLQKIQKLNKIAKYSLNDSEFYSNIDYVSNREIVPYTTCLKEKDTCTLRLSFGTTFDYLDDEIENTLEIHDNNEGEMLSYDYGYVNEYESDYTKNDKEVIQDETEIMNMLKKNGVEAKYDEVVEVKEHLEKLSQDPEFIKNVEKQMELMCSQYDDDDYYFMELYEPDHVCYKFKNEGITN